MLRGDAACTRNLHFSNRSTSLINRVLSLLLTFLAATGLSAHDLYILPQTFSVNPGSKLAVGYHNGDSFPGSEVAPTIARLMHAELLSAGSTAIIGDLKTDDKRVTGTVEVPAQRGTMILSAQTIPNLIQLEPDKFVDYLKEEGLFHVLNSRSQHGETQRPGRERYSKFAKSLVVSGSADDFYKHVVGFPIEIIPEANPSILQPGRDLPVRLNRSGPTGGGPSGRSRLGCRGKDEDHDHWPHEQSRPYPSANQRGRQVAPARTQDGAMPGTRCRGLGKPLGQPNVRSTLAAGVLLRRRRLLSSGYSVSRAL